MFKFKGIESASIYEYLNIHHDFQEYFRYSLGLNLMNTI